MTKSAFIIIRCDYYRDDQKDVVAVLKKSTKGIPAIEKYRDFIVSDFLDYFSIFADYHIKYNNQPSEYQVVNSSGDVIGNYSIENVPIV